MSIFLKAFLICCFLSIQSHAAHIKNLRSLHLENVSLNKRTWALVAQKIKLEDIAIIYISSKDPQALVSFYESDLKDVFRYIYSDDEHPDLAVISQIPLDYLKVYSFGASNYVIESASDEFCSLIINAHLPDFSIAQIETIKSYFVSSNPYLSSFMDGDFDLNLSFYESPFDLCAKGAVEVSAETDTKGSKSVKTAGEISSDDYRTKGTAELEYKENEKGEKEGRAKVSFRKQF